MSKLLHTQLTAFCSKCENWEYINGTSKISAAIEIAKSKGWKLDRANSAWTCPQCLGDADYHCNVTGEFR